MTSPPPAPIVLLGGDGSGTDAVFHALRERFGPPAVVLEDPVSRRALLRRRRRRLGTTTVVGQVLFQAVVVPLLTWRARRRLRELVEAMGAAPITGRVHRVPSVNCDEARDLLRDLAPAVVVVSGTRIIGPETLSAVDATFVNVHAGVTPRYRGVHGGYWALVDGRPELVGTTVHLVDEGIDTGGILAQPTFATGGADSFVTYPMLHVLAGLPALVEVVDALLAGRPPPVRAPLPGAETSSLRTHPTIWGYAARRIGRGVR